MNNRKLEDEWRERRLSEIGLSHEEYARMRKSAGWHLALELAELSHDGWLQRLRVAAAAGEKRAAEDREKRFSVAIYRAMEGGPTSMSTSAAEDLLAAVPAKLRDFAAKWAPCDGGRIILGPTGIGKSLACAAMTIRLTRAAWEAHEATKKGNRFDPDIAWARAVDISVARKQHPLGSEPALIEKAKESPVLVLDDLGWEAPSDGVVGELLALRYDRGRTTIVTSGAPYPELASRYGEAPLRRVLESGNRKGQIISLFAAKPVAIAGGKS